MLLKASAAITLYSPEICHELQDLVDAKKIKFVHTNFEPNQLLGACMAIAATDDETVNTAVSIAAKAQNIPVNVVDAPDLCTFTMGSIIDRSPVVIAIFRGQRARVGALYSRQN